jgi:protein TonB
MSLPMPRWAARPESPSKIILRAGGSAPRFQPPRFGSSFAENLSEWLKPGPRRIRGSKPSMLQVNWQARSASFWKSQAVSVAICCAGAIFLFFLSGARSEPPEKPIPVTFLQVPDLSEYPVKLPPAKDVSGGGGGGGKHSISPVTKGVVPKFKTFQLAPPSLPHNSNPILVAEASLLGSPDMQIPSLNLDRYGNPFATLINDSEGPGSGGGMGNGDGTGLGDGDGPGFGPGEHGGVGGREYRAGHGVGYPTCVYCPDAKYSDDARKAKFQGLVVLSVVVTPDGRATGIEVVSGPGLGLDEEARTAVSAWRFKPALGRPVATRISIELQFRLL